MSTFVPGSRVVVHTTRDDTRREIGYLPARLTLLERVVVDGDLYLQRVCRRHDRWRAMLLPGSHAGLQPLRPRRTACTLLSLWRGALVLGVERRDLYGLTVQLRVTRLGELALSGWRGLDRSR